MLFGPPAKVPTERLSWSSLIRTQYYTTPLSRACQLLDGLYVHMYLVRVQFSPLSSHFRHRLGILLRQLSI
jgi:hypothetical protein